MTREDLDRWEAVARDRLAEELDVLVDRDVPNEVGLLIVKLMSGEAIQAAEIAEARSIVRRLDGLLDDVARGHGYDRSVTLIGVEPDRLDDRERAEAEQLDQS